MNADQKKMIKKLNDDNKQLTNLHKSWIELSKVYIIAGIGIVVILLAILLFT